MSGTSLDGVDAVLADLSGQRPRILASSHIPFDDRLSAALLALNAPGDNEIERAALAGNELARAYARAIAALELPSHAAAGAVRALGCHGQTVRHRPELGYTVQLGNAALLAELTGLTVVADFRSRDVAAGGQGAPLVPAFHAAVFSSAGEDRVALNLGGIANLTWLPRDGEVIGFDTGPASCLLDLWAARHLGTRHDEGGAWGAQGTPDPALLARMLAEPYFSLAPPKSTGRDLFNAGWLESMLRSGSDARTVQATLMELTAQSVAGAIAQHCAGARRVIVCGGGTRNNALMGRLAELLSPAAVESSAMHGIPPNLVEATAFAWLAQQALEGRAGNLPAVTGARGGRILGGVYPG
jgi:anhydro-N-acetylmuramic acid kinase